MKWRVNLVQWTTLHWWKMASSAPFRQGSTERHVPDYAPLCADSSQQDAAELTAYTNQIRQWIGHPVSGPLPSVRALTLGRALPSVRALPNVTAISSIKSLFGTKHYFLYSCANFLKSLSSNSVHISWHLLQLQHHKPYCSFSLLNHCTK